MPNLIGWCLFAAFVGAAGAHAWHPQMLAFEGPQGVAKAIVWLAFIAFTLYSFYCSGREDLFRSISRIGELHWGRQIGLDLYLGLALSLALIYLHQGSLLVLALWLLPVLLFANLATLLYVALHFESLLQTLAG